MDTAARVYKCVSLALESHLAKDISPATVSLVAVLVSSCLSALSRGVSKREGANYVIALLGSIDPAIYSSEGTLFVDSVNYALPTVESMDTVNDIILTAIHREFDGTYDPVIVPSVLCRMAVRYFCIHQDCYPEESIDILQGYLREVPIEQMQDVPFWEALRTMN